VEKNGQVDAIASVLREKRICSSGCKERKLAHPKMVWVHDRSRESSSIDLLEVNMGWSTLDSALFFPGWIAFLNFLLADLELGEKKLEEKNSQEASRAKWPDLLSLTLFLLSWCTIDLFSCQFAFRLHASIAINHAHTRVMFVHSERQRLFEKSRFAWETTLF
jgi:hypothetical protein